MGGEWVKDILGESILAKETFFVRDIYAAQRVGCRVAVCRVGVWRVAGGHPGGGWSGQ